jgi:hypothetical protein
MYMHVSYQCSYRDIKSGTDIGLSVGFLPDFRQGQRATSSTRESNQERNTK